MQTKFDKLYNLIMEEASLELGSLKSIVNYKDIGCTIFATSKSKKALTKEDNPNFRVPSDIEIVWNVEAPAESEQVYQIIATSNKLSEHETNNPRYFLVAGRGPEPDFSSCTTMDEAEKIMLKYM